MHIKRFFEWIRLKEKLHFKRGKIPYMFEREVWWASLGENIGTEINGKSKYFSRPVIIIKKLSRESYFVIPISTQAKIGNWYVRFNFGNNKMTACLNQARLIDCRRFYSKLGILSRVDFGRVKKGFKDLYQ